MVLQIGPSIVQWQNRGLRYEYYTNHLLASGSVAVALDKRAKREFLTMHFISVVTCGHQIGLPELLLKRLFYTNAHIRPANIWLSYIVSHLQE